MYTQEQTTATQTAKQAPMPAGSRYARRGSPRGPFDFEIRVRLTPTEARLIRCLPLVGGCVRQWRVPVAGNDWRPHPTMPGVDIQFGAT